VLGAAGDGAERPDVGAESIERRTSHAFEARRLGDEHQLLLCVRFGQPVQAVDGRETRGLRRLVRAERDVEQHARRLLPDLRIAVPANRLRESGHAAELAHRSAPHARIRILPRDAREQFLIVFGEFLHAGQTYGRVRVLVARLRLETVEKTHAAFVRVARDRPGRAASEPCPAAAPRGLAGR
jgi:hypothetical protein